MSPPTRTPTKPWTAFFASALVDVSSGAAASLTWLGASEGDTSKPGSLAAAALFNAFCAWSSVANTLYGITLASITPERA